MKRPSVFFYLTFFLLLWCADMLSTFFTILVVSVLASAAFRFGVFENLLQQPIPPSSAVVITGTSTGFGKLFTLSLSQKSVVVFACVRKEEDGEKLIASAASEYRKFIIPVVLDVTDDSQMKKAVEIVGTELKKRSLSLFALVSNAGVSHIAPLQLSDMKKLRHSFEVNVFGTINFINSFAKLMHESKNCRVVILGSMAGQVNMLPAMDSYCATKSALESLADGYRHELMLHGIPVTLLEPGAFKTEFISRHFTDSALSAVDNSKLLGWEQQLITACKKMDAVAAANDKMPATWVSRQLERVLGARYPPARVLIGPDAMLATPIWSLLPDSVSDVLLWAMGKVMF